MRIPDGYVRHANQAVSLLSLWKTENIHQHKNISKIFNPSVEVVYSYDVISYAKAIIYMPAKMPISVFPIPIIR